MHGLVLSIFPGVGLLDRAFEETGFCVVRGPDLIWGGDIRDFHPIAGRFDGVIGGDPCPAHSDMRKFVEANGLEVAADLSGEYERILAEAQPRWFLRENVPGAAPLTAAAYTQQFALIRDHWCEGGGNPPPAPLRPRQPRARRPLRGRDARAAYGRAGKHHPGLGRGAGRVRADGSAQGNPQGKIRPGVQDGSLLRQGRPTAGAPARLSVEVTVHGLREDPCRG